LNDELLGRESRTIPHVADKYLTFINNLSSLKSLCHSLVEGLLKPTGQMVACVEFSFEDANIPHNTHRVL
jgi:hypothetical protein